MITRLLFLSTVVIGALASTSTTAQQTRVPGKVDSTPAAQQLADLDARQPVPLLPMMANHQKQNMRDHLLAIQEIVGALAKRDFAAVRRSASRIGFSPQTEQMCSHMGAGATGFAEKGVHFHHTADQIVEAAEKEDFDGALLALAETLEACNSCHSTFRQEVVDETTWEKATRSSLRTHPPAGNQ